MNFHEFSLKFQPEIYFSMEISLGRLDRSNAYRVRCRFPRAFATACICLRGQVSLWKFLKLRALHKSAWTFPGS